MLGGIIAGCTAHFEEYNRNPKQPSSIPTANLLQNTLQNLAYQAQNDAQRMYTFWGAYSGQVTAVANWSFGNQIWANYNPPTAHRNTPMSILFNQIYPNFYFIEEQTEKSGPIYGLALVLKVYAMHIVASAQGPLPYSQMQNGQIEAPYDDEVTAWGAMFEDLDRAIDILSGSGTTNADLSSVDCVYNGNISLWLKFANTLKLRMAMRVSSVAPYAQQKAEEAVAAGVMTDVSESAWVNNDKYGLKTPWSISWLGQKDKTDVEARPNACLVSWMNGYNDPRRPKYFTNSSGTSYLGAFSGPNSAPVPGNYTHTSHINYETETDPQAVIYAAEAAFLRAEGALKGWNMGGTAEDFYHEGIRLSLREFGVESSYDSYIATTTPPGSHNDATRGDNVSATTTISVRWESTADKQLEQILTQKWIALYLDPMNGWADYRRTGYPKLWKAAMSTNPDVTTARGPRRTPFPQTEYDNNKANVEAAAALVGGDSMGYDLWWAQQN